MNLNQSVLNICLESSEQTETQSKRERENGEMRGNSSPDERLKHRETKSTEQGVMIHSREQRGMKEKPSA